MNRILLPAFLLLIVSSCIVSKKKYDDLLAQKVRMETDLADRSTELDKANSRNDSPASKQKNRRTEIIITPDLDELFRILESN